MITDDNLAAQSYQQYQHIPATEKTIEDSLKELENLLPLPSIAYRIGRQQRKLQNQDDALWEVGSSYSSDQSFVSSLNKWNYSKPSDTATSTMNAGIALDTATFQQSDELIAYNQKISNTKSIPEGSRVFVIKSYSTEHIQISHEKGVWSSTEFGNQRLSKAYRSLKAGAKLLLLFSANGSGHFCGIAEMVSDVEEDKTYVWTQKKQYKGLFSVSWNFVGDVPNRVLKKFIIPSNEMKPVTQSRDTQEIPLEIARSIINVFYSYNGNHGC